MWSDSNFKDIRRALSKMHHLLRLKIVGLDQIYIFQTVDSKMDIKESAIKYLTQCILDLVKKSPRGFSSSELPQLFQNNYGHALDLVVLNSIDEFILTFIAGIKIQRVTVNGDFLISRENQQLKLVKKGKYLLIKFSCDAYNCFLLLKILFISSNISFW